MLCQKLLYACITYQLYQLKILTSIKDLFKTFFFFEKMELCLLAHPIQMSSVTISNEKFFFFISGH